MSLLDKTLEHRITFYSSPGKTKEKEGSSNVLQQMSKMGGSSYSLMFYQSQLKGKCGTN